MPATQPDGKRFYRPELDALRFFAFFAVFIHHALQALGVTAVIKSQGPLLHSVQQIAAVVEQAGNFGMSLFFVLSAYLITELLLIEVDRTGKVRIKDFYIRRILRIWPLYFFFLAVCVALNFIYPHHFAITGGRVAAFLLLAGNWYLVNHAFAPADMSVLWSISIEEQFYLVWPGIVRLGRGRRGVAIASAFFFLLSIGTLLYLGKPGILCLPVWFNSFVQFLFFAVGAQIALHTQRRQLNRPAWLRALLILGGVALWLASAGATHIMLQPGGDLLYRGQLLAGYGLAAAGTCLLFLGVLGIRASFVPQWLRYLGKISYGLYVFHMMTLLPSVWVLTAIARGLHFHGALLIATKLAVPLLSLGSTIAVSALSYRFLESPFLRLRKRFTVVASRPV